MTKIEVKRKMKMEVFATIDKDGIDGFGVNPDDRAFRQLRARANAWRGMQFMECFMNEEEFKEFSHLFREGNYKLAALYLYKVKEAQK